MSIAEVQAPAGAIQNLHEDELGCLAKRIKERDQLAERYAYAQWLENGRDLLTAKRILKHGDFGEWCERELCYSARTAQKLMRAAEFWGPLLKNEPGSHLPIPTFFYALSAPSVSQEIRDEYAPRVLAGENVGAELQKKIAAHRASTKRSKQAKARASAQTPEGRNAEEQAQIEKDRQAAARTEALELLTTRLGDDLPRLMRLAAEAGTGSLFEPYAARELQLRAGAYSRSEENVSTANEEPPDTPVPEDDGVKSALGAGNGSLPTAALDDAQASDRTGLTNPGDAAALKPQAQPEVVRPLSNVKFRGPTAVSKSFSGAAQKRRPEQVQ